MSEFMKGSDFSRIEKAIHFLVRNANEQPTLQDLAHELGMSEFHTHRLFKKWAGITPKDFLQLVTLAKAKALLKNSESVFNTSLKVGMSGGSRLHDLFIRYEAMTPGEFKSGARKRVIRWGRFESPLGHFTLGLTDRGICALRFGETDSETVRNFRRHWPKAQLVKSSKSLAPLAEEIRLRITGKSRGQKLKLLMKGTSFQVKVWEALLRIPEGQVTTYQEIANLIGAPKSTRAVGTAIGANPIGYLIPCHRVIRSTGMIGDYHWGPERKTALLAIEHAKTHH